MIQKNELHGINARIKKIEAGDFQSNDAHDLIMALRRHSEDCWILRELGDFVAHRGIRNTGKTNDTLRTFTDTLRYRDAYAGALPKPLNLDHPIPSFVFRFLISQCQKADIQKLKEYGFDKKSLSRKIKEAFKFDQDSKFYFFENKIDNRNFLNSVSYLCSWLQFDPVFNLSRLMPDLLVTMKRCGATFDENKFKKQDVRFQLSALCLTASTTFDLSDGASAISIMGTSRSNYRIVEGHQINKIHQKTNQPSTFGKLCIIGSVQSYHDGHKIPGIGAPLITTSLEPNNHCNENSFRLVEEKNEFDQLKIEELYLSDSMEIDQFGKLYNTEDISKEKLERTISIYDFYPPPLDIADI